MSDALAQVEQLAQALGLPLEFVLVEKAKELEARLALALVPDPGVTSEDDRRQFLRRVLSRDPTAEELRRSAMLGRLRRLPEQDHVALLQEQNFRCRLCGTPFDHDVRAEEDHKVPVALGGTDDVSNFQLLCRRCNGGKSALLGALPFGELVSDALTDRKRYCILSRDDGTCQWEGCDQHATVAQLYVVQRIAVFFGGRSTYDNLWTLCDAHVRQQESEDEAERLQELEA